MRQEQYKLEPHSIVNLRGLPWAICKHCGLVYLKNRVSRWAVKKGCNYQDHPGFRSELRLSCEEAYNARFAEG